MEYLLDRPEGNMLVHFYIKLIHMWTKDLSNSHRNEIMDLFRSQEMLAVLYREDVQEKLQESTIQEVFIYYLQNDWIVQNLGGQIYRRVQGCSAKLIQMEDELSSMVGFTVTHEKIVWEIIQFEWDQTKNEFETYWAAQIE